MKQVNIIDYDKIKSVDLYEECLYYIAGENSFQSLEWMIDEEWYDKVYNEIKKMKGFNSELETYIIFSW